jgi:Putative esterase
MHRYRFDDGTVLSLQGSAAPGPTTESALAVLFDRRPMIEEGIPDTIRSLQKGAVIGPLTTVYVESIEGASTTPGPTRVGVAHRRSGAGPVRCDLGALPRRPIRDLAGPDAACRPRHSLGANAALHVVCRRPDLFGAVATGSAALWWPGDEVQMPWGDVVDEVLASTDLRLWMQAGSTEIPDLLPRNRDLWERGDAAGPELSISSTRGDTAVRLAERSGEGGCRTCSGRDRTGATRPSTLQIPSRHIRQPWAGGAWDW